MERQALRDAVRRYDSEGLAGLRDRAEPGRPPALANGVSEEWRREQDRCQGVIKRH